MERGPKWEDLNMDCLVNILGRVDMETLLLDVPYVCKSWYEATCNPQCWTVLDFTGNECDECDSNDRDIYENFTEEEYQYWGNGFSKRLTRKYRLFNSSTVTSFIKYVVKRANGCVTVLKLPPKCTQEVFVYVSNECCNLRSLKLPNADMMDDLLNTICSAVSKWKTLENLSMHELRLPEILEQISTHCNNFGTLEIMSHGVKPSALVTLLPDLRALSLRYASISKADLLKILNGCKKLEYLDLRNTGGFDEDDDEILKSTAHITLKLECPKLRYKDEINNIWYCY